MNFQLTWRRSCFIIQRFSQFALILVLISARSFGQATAAPEAKAEVSDVPSEIQQFITDAASLLEKGEPDAAIKMLKKYRDWEAAAFRTPFKNKEQNYLRCEQLQKQGMAAWFEKEKAKAEAALQAGDVESVEIMNWSQFNLDQEQSQWMRGLRPRIEETKKKTNAAKFAKWQEQVMAFVSEAQNKCAACKDEAELESVYSQAIALGTFSYATGMNQELQQRYTAKLEAAKFTAKQLLEVMSLRALGREDDALDVLAKMSDEQRDLRSILKLSQLKELEAKFGLVRMGQKLQQLTSLKDIDELEATLKSVSKTELKRLSIVPDRQLNSLKAIREIANSIAEGNSKAGLRNIKSYLNSSDSISSVRSIAAEVRQTALEMEIKKYTGKLPVAPVTASQHAISALEAAIAKEDLNTAENLLELLQSEFSKEVPNSAAELLALKDWAAAKRYEESNDFQMATRYWRKIIGSSDLKYVPMAKFQKRLAEQIAAHPEVSAPGVDNLLQEMQQLRIEVKKLSELMIRK